MTRHVAYMREKKYAWRALVGGGDIEGN